MKGFFTWFKSSTKIKRWIFLILIGIVLACYGFAQILVINELSFEEIGKIVAVFVVGFTFVILGLVYIQKRTLELVIEGNQKKEEKNVNISSLIFNKDVYENGPKIVAIGGGNGLNAVLAGLKKYTNNITAIVTISDYGEIPTESRKQLDLLPLEDIKGSLIALAKDSEKMERLFNVPFMDNKLKGLTFGDIYMSAMKNANGDFTSSIKESSEILNITGKVLPVTFDEIKICAELVDGTIVEEKSKIPEVVYEKVSKINRIYITPSNCTPAPGVLEAINEADAIILGPGSLYTNVIPNLLVKNIAKTIKESKALKIYISNLMTEPGQTDNYTLSEHINAITEHVGKGLIDFCICDTQEITPEFVRKYNKMGSDIVEMDTQKIVDNGIKVLKRDLSCIKDEYIRHDSDAIAKSIVELICNDLKFRDKQTEPEYLLMNSKLKQVKKTVKKNKPNKKVKNVKKEKNVNTRKKQSKLASKYKERMEYIQNSEKQRIENIKKQEKEEE